MSNYHETYDSMSEEQDTLYMEKDRSEKRNLFKKVIFKGDIEYA